MRLGVINVLEYKIILTNANFFVMALEQFSEVVNKLAEKYRDEKGIQFVRVDGTKNDLPGALLDGFPSVFLYTQGSESPAIYDGDFSYEDVANFLHRDAG